MAATAFLHQQMTAHPQITAAQALNGTKAAPMDTAGTSSSSSDSGDSATISANDFLTLLVTEMQNQDPTADTDPNEYINQLVQVNSLEQLIDINQTLSTDLGSPAAAVPGAAPTPAVQKAAMAMGQSAVSTPQPVAHVAAAQSPATFAATASSTATSQAATASHTFGNLSAPSAHAAAQRVAHALDGRTRAQAPLIGSPRTQ